jgi:hypothetical protein
MELAACGEEIVDQNSNIANLLVNLCRQLSDLVTKCCDLSLIALAKG